MDISADQVRPLRDQLVVEVLAQDLTRKSGIVIPDNVAHASCQGTVIATGPEVDGILPGDHILFEPYQDNQFFQDGDKEWLLVRGSDVLGRFTDEEAEKFKPEHERLLSIV